MKGMIGLAGIGSRGTMRLPSAGTSMWVATLILTYRVLVGTTGEQATAATAAGAATEIAAVLIEGFDKHDGSSPSEGFFEKTKSLQIGTLLLPRLTL